MEIGDRIRKERRRVGLTQVQLADRVGVDKSAVAQWESPNSRKGINTVNLIKVANTLGVSVSALTGVSSENDEVKANTSQEIALLTLYRQMTPEQQDIYLSLFYVALGLSKPVEAESNPAQRKRIGR